MMFETLPMEQVCEVISRGRAPSYCEKGGMLVVNQKCIRDGRVEFALARMTDVAVRPVPGWAHLQDGDCLINSTGTGTLGRAALVAGLPSPTTIDTHVTLVRPRTEVMYPAYLAHYLRAIESVIVELAEGATGQTELARDLVKKIEVPCPSLDEQRRIVALLDEATQLITDLESTYAQTEMKYAELASSALESALASVAGDRRVRLGDACEIRNGATPKTGTKAYWDGPHQWLTPAEMGGLSSPVIMSTRRTLSDAGLASCSASLSPPNSVILSCRAPIGHLAINAVPMATNQGCKTLIPGSDLDFRYLYYCLLVRRQMLDELGTGATFRELSAGKLREVEIPVPSLDDQTRVVGLLDG